MEQGHNAGALHGFGQLALVLGGDAGAAARQNLAIGVDKLFQELDVLIVDFFDVVALEVALLDLLDRCF